MIDKLKWLLVVLNIEFTSTFFGIKFKNVLGYEGMIFSTMTAHVYGLSVGRRAV